MRWLLRRLGWSVFVVWATVSIAFAVNTLLPGDPARMVAGAQAREVDVARIRDQLGLDQPPLTRYVRFWERLVHFGPAAAGAPGHADCATIVTFGSHALHVDLGRSYQKSQPVADLIAQRFPRSFALALAGVLVQLVFGVTTGVLAASRRGSWIDRAVVGTSLLGISLPTFLVAIVLQYVFAYGLRWLPLDGFGTTTSDHARCLVLPALTLGIFGAAYYTRLVRDEVAVLLEQDWVRTARAKGASTARVLVRHALRNALVPIVTSVGLDFGALLGGAIVTETVFRWPGLGALAVSATHDRDGPIVLACVIASAVVIVTANLLVDVVHGRLDPRVRA
jgi:peptide/nickel transport system permease protein